MRFTKIGTNVRTPKRRNEFVSDQYRPTLPIVPPKTPILGQAVLKIHADIKQSYICLKMYANRRNFRVLKEIGSRNTIVASDIRPEVEIRPFRACALKNVQYNPYFWRIAEISASWKKSGSRNTIVTSDLRAEVEIWPLRACTMHLTIIIGTVRSLWTWLWGRYHVPQNVFLVIGRQFNMQKKQQI